MDASGNVGINTASPNHALHVDNGPIASSRYGSPGAIILRSAAGTQTSPTAINTSTNLSVVVGRGYDGSVYRDIASITMQSDGAITSTSSPGFIAFNTTQSSSTAAQERLRITSAGLVGVGVSSPQLPLTIGLGGGANPATSGSTQSSGGIARIGSSGAATLDIGTLAAGATWLQATNVTNLATNYSLLLNPNGGNVGIGTLSAQTPLHVSTANSEQGRFESTGASYINVKGPAGQNLLGVESGAGWVGPIESIALAFKTGNSERGRFDSSGRLLIGTSSVTANNAISVVQGRSDSGTAGGSFLVAKGPGDPVDGGALGDIRFSGNNHISSATIVANRDGGTWTAGSSQPSRLVFSTTADGASSPTERLRITNDGVQAYNQPAPAAVNATATLTVANLKAGIITSTSAAATDMTLPTGTDTQAGFSGTYDNFTFEWSVINTGPSLVRVLAATAHTIVGSGSVATGTSGRFASRRTAANTFVTYRLC